MSLAMIAALLAAAPCPPDPRVAPIAEAFLARRALPHLMIAPAEALCFRERFLARIGPAMGPVVGYKVAAWTPAARAVLGGGPAIGVFRRAMMLPEGLAVRTAAIGLLPVAGADFVLVVRDAGINRARTRDALYRHLRGWRPFVELPDNLYPPADPAGIGRLTALNGNARAGILGREVPLARGAAGRAALAALRVDVAIRRPDGRTMQTGVARETLGDPLDIALAARDMLRDQGISLKAGDVISIGTLTPPQPPVPGTKLTIDYHVGPARGRLDVDFVE